MHTLILSPANLTMENQWVLEPGDFQILVAAAADDIKLKTSLNIK